MLLDLNKYIDHKSWIENVDFIMLSAISHSSCSQERRNAQCPSPANAQVTEIEFGTEPKNSKLILITIDELKYAKKNFSESCKIGQGGFRTLFPGEL